MKDSKAVVDEEMGDTAIFSSQSHDEDSQDELEEPSTKKDKNPSSSQFFDAHSSMDSAHVDEEMGLAKAQNRPTLYEEARAMLSHCAMIYTIAEYRNWSSNNDTAATEMPLTSQTIQELASECKDQFLLQYAPDGEERVKIIDNILKSWRQNNMTLVRFEDHNQNEELVYAIAVEPKYKRIVLIFRGSVTSKDWSADFDAQQISVDISNRGLSFKKAILHRGFFEYLFETETTGDENKNNNKTTDTQKKKGSSSSLLSFRSRKPRSVSKQGDDAVGKLPKYHEIRDQLKEIFAEHPGFQLYVTGHSLGGALCCLFSVFACTEPDKEGLPEQISCFSFASPKVGTQVFQRLMQQSEMDGSLRFLRTINQSDPVTNLPKDVRWLAV